MIPWGRGALAINLDRRRGTCFTLAIGMQGKGRIGNRGRVWVSRVAGAELDPLAAQLKACGGSAGRGRIFLVFESGAEWGTVASMHSMSAIIFDYNTVSIVTNHNRMLNWLMLKCGRRVYVATISSA